MSFDDTRRSAPRPRQPSRRQFLGQLAAAGTAGGLGTAAAAPAPPPSAGGQGGQSGQVGGGAERRLGVALVGLGKLTLGQLIPAFKNTRACRLAALVSGSPEKARRHAAANGVPDKSIYTYQTFDRLADNPDVDIVYVVLPNAMHAEYTIRAARAGKHVLCEKPMAVTTRECEEMIAACKKAGRQLAIAYRLRFEPHNLELVRLARTRELGAVKIIEAAAGTMVGDPRQWRLDRKLSGGGSLVDIGIYALQAARYIAGEEPISVSARQTVTDKAKFKGIDETLLFSMTFPSGVVANGTSSYATFVNRFMAATDRGERFGAEPGLNYHGIRGFRTDGKPFTFPDIDQFAAEMDAFARAARDGHPTTVPGEEGLRDVRIMDAMYRSAETGREVRLGV